jgi:hypothetical protein
VYALLELGCPRQGVRETNRLPGGLLSCRQVKNTFSPPVQAKERLPLNNSVAAELAMTMGALELKVRGTRALRDTSPACIAVQSSRL